MTKNNLLYLLSFHLTLSLSFNKLAHRFQKADRKPPYLLERLYMSLELALHENTAAIRDLIAEMGAAFGVRVTPPGTIRETKVTMTAAAYVATLDKPVAALAVVKSKELDEAVEVIEKAAAVVVPVTLDYTKDIKPMLVKLSTSKGRDALVGLLAKYGVAKGDALPAGLLGAVANEINVLLAA